MTSLTHVAMHILDLDGSIRFYRDYCGMSIVHERSSGEQRITWMAEPGRENDFIFVMISGGHSIEQAKDNYGHLGFAVESRERVDALARQAKEEGRLYWEPVQEKYPVGYYCGVKDPNGIVVEFSYGQPLGPGAESSL